MLTGTNDDGPLRPIPVYIGWDPREVAAYRVAVSSLRRFTTVPIAVIPLKLNELKPLLTRPIVRRNDGKLWCPISEAPMSTEFAISRFCVPFLQSGGWALFCDCDVLFQADIAELWALRDPKYAVMVVKHNNRHDQKIKMDGCVQTQYERKNWSSFCLWNLDHPANLRFTETDLNNRPGRELHAFDWLSDAEIGELPGGWNHLVDVNPPIEATEIKCLHYTLGTPIFPTYGNCTYADRWWMEYTKVFSS